MTKLSMLPTILAAAFAFAAGPAQAEMKSQWVEYSHGDTKLKAYMAYDDKVSGKRPAVLVVHAREGMTPKTQALTELWAKLGYVSFAADIFGYGQGVLPKDVAGNAGPDRDLQRGPRADARTDAGGLRCAPQEPDGRPGEGRAHRLLLRRRGRRRVRLDRRATRRQCLDPRLVPRPSRRMGEERQGHVSDPARRRGPGLSRSRWSTRWSRNCAAPRFPSRWRFTAAPATASPRPRTRTRSAPTRSRSPRPDGHSRSFSASERGGNLRSSSRERPVRLMEDQFVQRPVRTAAEFHAEALKLDHGEGSGLVGSNLEVGWLPTVSVSCPSLSCPTTMVVSPWLKVPMQSLRKAGSTQSPAGMRVKTMSLTSGSKGADRHRDVSFAVGGK